MACFLRRLLALVVVAALVLPLPALPAEARVVGPPDGGGAKGNGASGATKDPCEGVPPPAIRRPWAQNKCYYIVASETYEKPDPPEWAPTNDWTWGYRVDASFQGGITKSTIEWAPGYPKNVDEISHIETLKYIFAGSTEGPYYITDRYRDWLRYYYNLVRLERGRVSFRWLCWVRVWKRDIWRKDRWNDGVTERYKVDERRSTRDGPGETNPDSVCNLNAYSNVNLWGWIPFSEDEAPIKAPPIDRPIPPSGVVPPPVWDWPLDYLGGREILKRDYKHRDDWGRGGAWDFGGKPLSDPVSGIRGGFADIGIRAIAQGAPGGKQQVTRVRLRVLPPFPDSGWQYLGLSSGSHTDGIWRTMIRIPRKGVVLRPYRYTVEAVIEGTNFWGMKRVKVIRFQLVIDEGEGPDDPRGKGPCRGLTEDDIRRLGSRWLSYCAGSRLIK